MDAPSSTVESIALRGGTAESRLVKTVFLVQATNFEQHMLWKERAEDNTNRRDDLSSLKWESPFWPSGWIVTVGELMGRPCCIDISWSLLDGHPVAFYYECSQVTDRAQTEKWLVENFKATYDSGRRAVCDAMNFHNCIRALRGVTKACDADDRSEA